MKRVDAANHARAIQGLKSEILSLQRSLWYFQERCGLLEAILKEIDPNLIPPRSCSAQRRFVASRFEQFPHENEPVLDEDDNSLSNLLICDIEQNSSRKPNGRQWNPLVKSLCFVIRALGSKSYDYMRNYITLPCKQTLLEEHRDEMIQCAANLVDINMVPVLCHRFRERCCIGEHEEVDAVLSIDAMAMEPFLDPSNTTGIPHNSVFLFQILPLRCEQRAFPLHLMTRSSGSAGSDVVQLIDHLCTVLPDSGIMIRAVATDGDPAYNFYHERLFNTWLPVFSKRGLDAAVDSVSHSETRIVSDFLHLLKNARSRLLNCNVTMSPLGVAAFNASQLNEHLHLGSALTDLSMKGRMRDIYPLEIFTLENVCVLYDADQVNMALYILPYALLVHAIRNPGISVQMRRQLLDHVVQVFTYHINVLSLLDKKVVSENKKGGVVQYFCSRRHAMRICNTAMILLVELNRISGSLALDRLGTHVTECTFGLIRLMCHNKHNWKTIHRAFARVTLLEDLAKDLDHPIRISGRENVGGTKITSEDDKVFVLAQTPDMARIYEYALLLIAEDPDIAPKGSPLHQTALEAAGSYVTYIKAFCRACEREGIKFAKLWHGSSVSNSTIFARLLSFLQVTPEESQARDLDEDRP